LDSNSKVEPRLDPGARAPKSSYKARVQALASQREQRMAEINALLRQRVVAGSFVDKAQTLLTNSWSKATWRSRASILRTVDWLLHLEQAHRRDSGGRADQVVALADRGRVR
jgi:hypothetical protein